MRASQMILILSIILLTGCIGCCSKTIGIQAESGPDPGGAADIPPPPPSHAPGTALVYAELIDILELDRSFRCTLKIITVFGYGSSTPPIAENGEITASVPKALWNRVKKAADSPMAPGSRLKMTIRSSGPRLAGTAGPDWQTLAIDSGEE